MMSTDLTFNNYNGTPKLGVTINTKNLVFKIKTGCTYRTIQLRYDELDVLEACIRLAKGRPT